MTSRFGTKEEVLTRLEGLRRFNEWGDAHPNALSAQQVFAAVGALYELLPASTLTDEHGSDGWPHLRIVYEALGRIASRG